MGVGEGQIAEGGNSKLVFFFPFPSAHGDGSKGKEG